MNSNISNPVYYLSSLESELFEPVRLCRVTRKLTFDTGKSAIEVELTPTVIGQEFNRGSDIDNVILTARYESATVDPVDQYPCFVFITIPRIAGSRLDSPLCANELQIIAWGEVYRTSEDAKRHRFD